MNHSMLKRMFAGMAAFTMAIPSLSAVYAEDNDASVSPSPIATHTASSGQEDRTSDTVQETDNEILNYVHGDKEKAQLYKFLQNYVNHDIKQNTPFATLTIGPKGSTTVTRSDGTYTIYRYGQEPQTFDKNGTLTTQTASGSTEISEHVYSVTGKKETESAEYLKSPTYRISGTDGEKLQFSVKADDGEKIRRVYENKTLSTIRNHQFTKMVEENDEKSAYTFTLVLHDHCSDHLTAYFTDSSVSAQNSETNDENVNSGDGTLFLHALADNEARESDIYADKWSILPDTSDATFNQLVTRAGGHIEVNSLNKSLPAPRLDQPYTFSWKVDADDNGNQKLNVRIHTDDVKWNTQYSSDTQDEADTLPGIQGTITIPSSSYQLNVKINQKTSKTIQKYAQNKNQSLDFQYDIKDESGHSYGVISVSDGETGTLTADNVPANVTKVLIVQTKTPDFLKTADPQTVEVQFKNNQGYVDTQHIDNQMVGAVISARDNIDGTSFTFKNTSNDRTYHVDGGKQLDVEPGTYIITEDSVPAGYYLNQAAQKISVEAGQTQTFTFNNTKISIQVRNTLSSNNTLQLIDTDDNKTVLEEWNSSDELYTLGSGTLHAEWNGTLLHGHSYQVVKKDDSDYSDNLTIHIPDTAPDAPPVYNFGETTLQYSVRTINSKSPVQDDKNNPNRVGGEHLQLKKVDDNTVLEEWDSDTDRDHMINTDSLQENQEYVIHVETPAKGYYSPADDIKFTALNTGGVTDTLIDAATPIQYEISQVDSDTKESIFNTHLHLVDNADPDTVLDTWTTGAESKSIDVTTDDKAILAAGHTYNVIAEDVPGYYSDDNQIQFTVSGKAEQDKPVSITLNRHPIAVYIDQLDGISGKQISGASFSIQKQTLLSPLMKFLGISSNQDSIDITTSKDDSDNRIWNNKESINLLEPGVSYRLTTTRAPDGYFPPSEEHNSITFTVPSTWKEVQQKYPGGKTSVAMYYYPIRIAIQSVDTDGTTPAKGGQFSLVSADTQYTLATWTSDTDPEIISGTDSVPSDLVSDDLQAGKSYWIKEDSAAPGYYYTENVKFMIPATLSNDALKAAQLGESVPVIIQDVASDATKQQDIIQITNQPINWHVRFDGELSPTNNLKLGIYEQQDDGQTPQQPKVTLTPDDPSFLKSGYWKVDPQILHAGHTYIIKEEQSPNGYKPNSKEYVVNLNKYAYTDNSDIILSSIANQPFSVLLTVTDDQENVLTSYLDKTDMQYKPFEFEIFQEDENHREVPVGKISTDKSVDLAKYMLWGKQYVIRESGPEPTGYYKAKDITVNLKDDIANFRLTAVIPAIKARFRKENENGEPIAYIDKEGNQHGEPTAFNFKLEDVTDPANPIAVKAFNLTEADTTGYVSIGRDLTEGHIYQITEISHPHGLQDAEPIRFTVPHSQETPDTQITEGEDDND